ncbi:Ig-like domain-containing protein [Moritella sp. 28]|uniref:Ig-like domain-containing protein n=1 Tax=Moritella sp. 28 TaxID=2746232 RepID=UPI001BAD7C0B|nr:Ig-like domain-containing protein [Moritella sp. 28]QUM83833.1 Ig-like domain-containing protein [Moritella sp. 28]
MKTVNFRLNSFFSSFVKGGLVASAVMLAGCGLEPQDNEKVKEPILTAEESRDELAKRRAKSLFDAHEFYSYPSNGQGDVAVNTSVLLSFSHPLDSFSTQDFSLIDSNGNVVEVASVEVTEGSFATDPENPKANGLAFKPKRALKTGEQYTVIYEIGLINEAEGNKELTVERTVQDPLTFTTRLGKDSANFALDTNGFYPTDDLPFTTFTSLRLRMTNEIDIKTLITGDSFKFQKIGSTEQVSGDLIAKGRYITFDPTVDLDADATYELIVSSDVKDKVGNSFAGLEKTFTVLDSGDHAFKPMNVTLNNGYQESPYSGELINAVTIKSVLIGTNDTTYVDSDLITELANLGNFDESAPLVIRKGSILNSSNLTVKVGGEFPTGFDTGNIRMTNISDATGYLINNTSSDNKYAPKQLHLFMDVAMTTDGYLENGKLNGKANGGLSQNIMHLELMGAVRTEGPTMIIDAISEIDLKILGVDNAHAQVSFHMESYTEVETPPAAFDALSPVFHSTYPNVNTAHFSLGDNVTITYNEPLDLASLQNLILKDENGSTVETFISQDGASIIIDPTENLIPLTDYTVNGVIKDLAGNSTYVMQSFSTPNKEQGTEFEEHDEVTARYTAPMVEGMVPGYSCAFEDTDLGLDIAGRCAGGLTTDQKLNIFSLQEDRGIFVAFSQQMDEASIRLGEACNTGSFRVEIVEPNGSGNCIETVPGVLNYENKILTFSPSDNWQDQGSNVYRYSLISAEGETKGSVDCSTGEVLCSAQGYPLQTTLLKPDSHEDLGGPDMLMPFRAAPADNLVFNPLMMPTTDTNRDYRWDEIKEEVVSGNFAKLSLLETGGALIRATVGCELDQTCSDDYAKTHISGFMPTEVGEYDVENNRIPVKVHAEQLISSNVNVAAMLGFFNIGLIESEVPTGTMIMRPKYSVVNGKTEVPTGYIIWNEEENRLNFKIDLDIYMDNPFMSVLGGLVTHNLHSYPLENVHLQGPLTFLDDGRMNIELSNLEQIKLDVVLNLSGFNSESGIARMTLAIAPGDMSLQQISQPMK